MEDLTKIYELSETYPRNLEQRTEEWLLKLRVLLWGQAAIPIAAKEKQDIPAASPQQTKKRIKRLSSLNELEEADGNVSRDSVVKKSEKTQSPRKSKRSNAELLAAADAIDATVEAPVPAPRTQEEDQTNSNTTTNERKSDATNLMPPPPAPIVAPAPILDEASSGRPQRAAKLKSEKNLKEQGLRGKLRRPTNDEVIAVKLEHEHRPSQMHEAGDLVAKSKKQSSVSEATLRETESLASSKSDESVVVVSGKQPPIVSIDSDLEDAVVQTTAANTINEKSQEKDATKTQEKKSLEPSENAVRELRIKIKREKVSISTSEETKEDTIKDDALFKAPGLLPAPIPMCKNETATIDDTSSLASTILSSTTNTTTAAPAKKGRKKKEVHKPIKVERFSDLDPKPSPISSRTRHGSIGKSPQREEEQVTVSAAETKRPASIYEDAIETPPSHHSQNNTSKNVTSVIGNETVNIGLTNDATMNLGTVPADATINLGPVPGDATFCTNPAQTTFQVAPGQTTFVMDSNPNATVTLNKLSGAGAVADATFDIHQLSKAAKDDDAAGQRSFETAKDSSMPHDDSLLTEDECEQQKPVVATKSKISNASVKSSGSSKSSVSTKTAYKMPTRTNELFNPLAQSPVKMRVEAFENAAAAATEQSKRPVRIKKENVTPSAITTPVIGKLTGPALGRFLTPTQGSNVATHNSAIAKKGVTSAKALPMTKSASASNLQRSNSTTATKTLQRENSADDFRKGLHNLAEERKKQREQKHLLAAQQREAKERERAERMAKLAKEREEKRLVKKQQEQEQKKRELDDIQRKLRQQQEEEAAKQKAAKERELLMQMKQQQLAKQRMMPPPPKTASKYAFEMLHEDDSTDDEDKVSYKRPPPPSWSRSHIRGPNMLKQEYTPAAYIDSFFSVQPMTPDLKIIFPNIDARHLKRNSSVLWSTPPRYSELPKY